MTFSAENVHAKGSIAERIPPATGSIHFRFELRVQSPIGDLGSRNRITDNAKYIVIFVDKRIHFAHQATPIPVHSDLSGSHVCRLINGNHQRCQTHVIALRTLRAVEPTTPDVRRIGEAEGRSATLHADHGIDHMDYFCAEFALDDGPRCRRLGIAGQIRQTTGHCLADGAHTQPTRSYSRPGMVHLGTDVFGGEFMGTVFSDSHTLGDLQHGL